MRQSRQRHPPGPESIGEDGVSETVGAIILISVAALAMGIVLLVLLASPLPTNVPAFSGIISKAGGTIYIYHTGGEPLYSGQYKIFVNGTDMTSSFVGPNPFTVGTNLSYTFSPPAPSPSQRVVMVFNTPTGGGTILLSATLPPAMLPTFVQINATSTTTGKTLSDIFPGSSTPGDLIVVSSLWNLSSGGNFVSIADNMGNRYNVAVGQNSYGGANVVTWYASNIKAGAAPINITVTLTGSESGFPYFETFATEYSGVQVVNPFDKAIVATGTGTTFDSGYVSTTQAIELLYGFTWTSQGATVNAPFNTRSNYQDDVAADTNVSVMGSYHFTGTLSGTADYICQMGTFRGG